MQAVLSVVLRWLGANWLPVLIGSVVFIGYLWVSNLVTSRDEALVRIQQLEVQTKELALEAKRQADAFEFLEGQFKDYQQTVDTYIKALTSAEKNDKDAKEAVNTGGTKEARDKPVDPYIRDVLEKLCKLYPAHCER